MRKKRIQLQKIVLIKEAEELKSKNNFKTPFVVLCSIKKSFV